MPDREHVVRRQVDDQAKQFEVLPKEYDYCGRDNGMKHCTSPGRSPFFYGNEVRRFK